MDNKLISEIMGAIPSVAKICHHKQFYGHPLYNDLYGYYHMDGKVWAKLKMRLKNG